MHQVYSKSSLLRFQEMILGSALTTRNCNNKEQQFSYIHWHILGNNLSHSAVVNSVFRLVLIMHGKSILIYWHEVQSYFGHCSYLLFVYPGNIQYRSQKTCSLQKDEGLFVRQHGASRAAINSGRILGFRTSLRDVDSHQKFLVASYTNSLQKHLNQAIKV